MFNLEYFNVKAKFPMGLFSASNLTNDERTSPPFLMFSLKNTSQWLFLSDFFDCLIYKLSDSFVIQKQKHILCRVWKRCMTIRDQKDSFSLRLHYQKLNSQRAAISVMLDPGICFDSSSLLAKFIKTAFFIKYFLTVCTRWFYSRLI